jgi:hypothetical protein
MKLKIAFVDAFADVLFKGNSAAGLILMLDAWLPDGVVSTQPRLPRLFVLPIRLEPFNHGASLSFSSSPKIAT